MIVNPTTSRSTDRTDPRSRTPSVSCASIRLLSELARPTSRSSSSVDEVMNPSPPTWMSNSTTA